ncbi:MAG TPA: sigma-70 family RNA polymerase sigma factor [Longimicrobiales bacterium]
MPRPQADADATAAHPGTGIAPGGNGPNGDRIAVAFARERGRLWKFIRARVAEHVDAEDILQDVFTELVVAYRLAKPIEHLGGWLFQVARNRITDRFRRRRREAPLDDRPAAMDDDARTLESLLPAPDAGPEAAYARRVLLEAIEDALAELPRAQREVFIAHELEGRSFKEIAAETGVGINTLLSRKRYAVLHLRRRLRSIYDDFTGKESLT